MGIARPPAKTRVLTGAKFSPFIQYEARMDRYLDLSREVAGTALPLRVGGSTFDGIRLTGIRAFATGLAGVISQQQYIREV